MSCPHCEEDIDELIRTGERKYSCGQCSMVIAYDDIEPHLDEFEVTDKRGDDGEEDEEVDMVEDLPPPPGSGQAQTQQGGGMGTPNEREIIYQRGTEGLKQIKKDRLKNWLANTDGVGGQTEQRILMVFSRNDSVHKNPHVLYNLLDDELSASASYINTMVQDIFAPEEEHGDILESQGYTPWYDRRMSQGGGQTSQQFGQQPGGGAPMGNDQGSSFNQTQESDDGISRQEAEMMMQQAVQQDRESGGDRALLDGLSDATDEAVREMASNVGGLAGTVQRVIDEALVQYARENPEWVINNMGVLQKVLGATNEIENEAGSQEKSQPEENAKIDEALNNLNGGGSEVDIGDSAQPTVEENPDIDDSMMEGSSFDPNASDGMSSDNNPMQGQPEPPDETQDVVEESDSEDESFDEIFGDIE